MPTELELVDKELLNILQSRFPLVEEPYDALGAELGVSTREMLQRIRQLKKRNIVRQISAIFDTRRLGYKTTLVAMRLPKEQLKKAAYLINEHPGVSHNYERTGHFNLWFTVAVPPDESLEETIADMERRTGALACRIMSTLRFFKIGVNFDMVTGEGAAYDYYSPDGYNGDHAENWNKVEAVTDFEIQVIRELQEDLPLKPRPFDAMAQRLGIATQELFGYAASFQERGVMRRYSAVLHHRRAGFSANGMGVWRVPEERAEEVGQIMAQHPAVSHCYQRPTFPDWPYTHFTMIHAQSKARCEAIADEISRETGISDFQLLYSTREYKKTRVRYFA